MNRTLSKLLASLGAAVLGSVIAWFPGACGDANVYAQQGASSKTVSMIVPFPPGGGTDGLARIVVPKFAAALGRTVIIENKPGAGGNIAADFVKNAPPDGTTLLFSGDNMAINAALNKQTRFDPTASP